LPFDLSTAEEETMLTRYHDSYDPTLALVNAFRQQFDRFFDHYEAGSAAYEGGPRLELFETKEAFVLRADVPGLTEKDVTLTVTQDVFTIAGERQIRAPEGYVAHRQERPSFHFSRSFTLPAKTDLERASANVKNGVLTVHLPKAPEAKPQQIAVRSE
jgi:HSP20 family protein